MVKGLSHGRLDEIRTLVRNYKPVTSATDIGRLNQDEWRAREKGIVEFTATAPAVIMELVEEVAALQNLPQTRALFSRRKVEQAIAQLENQTCLGAEATAALGLLREAIDG